MEDFVPFEIAKKLKEKGFNESCINAVNKFGCTYLNGWCEYLYDRDNEDITLSDLKNGDYLLPTISQVLDWLRIEKEIDIAINPIFTYDDNLNRIREYSCDIFAPQLNKPYRTNYYDSYEQASLVGIEYVLNNLI